MKKLLVIISMFMVFLVGYGKVKPLDVNMEAGTKIPNFELRDFNGKYTKSRKIFNNGKPTLLVFAAEWCPHCHTELPEVQKFYEENKDNINVVVVFTSRRTNLTATKQFVAENKFTFPVYYDANQSLMNGFKVKNVPTNLIIQNSVIENVFVQIMDYDNLKQAFYLN
ncbi:alkyl hydroperoxide reductase [Leptotrichia trevisanii]|uniref:Alkyl hydroperoxide reductase n=1 Tax=Leptotrichia trevisanii TaxID=109328 RepID=A0A510JYM6_9FUSO|nr:TlpA disulfide reductase family protein [Leptotrichia trevisanii]BBM44490.1 alkyl hydroperoxide reductase [Leptotrichia trevisanii]BBM56563.1 alkyl hydroperoxide reductase [Leptotrichia trevisanii]